MSDDAFSPTQIKQISDKILSAMKNFHFLIKNTYAYCTSLYFVVLCTYYIAIRRDPIYQKRAWEREREGYLLWKCRDFKILV